MTKLRVWDPVVRVFHWALVAGFAADALFVEDESKLHENIGYAVVALIALRIVWGLVGSRHARFSDFPPDPAAALRQLQEIATRRVHRHVGHTPLGALMIYNLLASILAIGLTGWMMTTTAFWGVDWVEEVHETLVVWAGLSVAVHVGAVIFESLRTGVNLPRAMVTGWKTLPGEERSET